MDRPAARPCTESAAAVPVPAGTMPFPTREGTGGSNILDLQAGLTVLCCHPGDLDGSFGPQVEESGPGI